MPTHIHPNLEERFAQVDDSSRISLLLCYTAPNVSHLETRSEKLAAFSNYLERMSEFYVEHEIPYTTLVGVCTIEA